MAFLHSEPGADIVWEALPDSIISAVNYSEVLKKAVERGKNPDGVASAIGSLKLGIVPFGEELVLETASLYPLTKPHGMSFADRACLALGTARGLTVLTTDRKMGLLKLPITVRVIRNAH